MTKYNGYTNFETWAVAAAIDNTESLYNFCQDMVKETSVITDKDSRKAQIMNILKNMCLSMMPDTSNPIWGPIMHGCLQDHINFSEIADGLLDS